MSKPVALITGASRGLGAELAKSLSSTYHIIAVSRTIGALEELDDQIKKRGGSSTLAPIDLINTNAVAQLCRSIFDRWGKVRLWAHTAIHAAPLGPVITIDSKDWEKSIANNVTVLAKLIPMVSPLLQEDSKAIFFEDTTIMKKFSSVYGATKAAQIQIVKTWQDECKSTGPKIYIAQPNPMPTAVRARFYPGENRKELQSIEKEAKRLVSLLKL
ncbi:SDR family oxidoreductase [Paracoccaceae bacterium]|jgi:NADP-dependent 3-hydroxy acid dehydrogenase YdfG|nr:SDR family oxidoreductase [Paracoccaceae bacterium]